MAVYALESAKPGPKIERAKRARYGLPGNRNTERNECDERARCDGYPPFHFASCTTSVPKPVRPKRSGRYMSSTDAGGRT